MANALLKGGAGFAKIAVCGREGLNAWISYESPAHISGVELNYTTDTGMWRERSWQTIPADLDTSAQRATMALPPATTVYYFNIIDERNLVVSSEHEEISSQERGFLQRNMERVS